MGAFAAEDDDLLTALMNYTKREATFARARLAAATARLEDLKLIAKMLGSTQLGTGSK